MLPEKSFLQALFVVNRKTGRILQIVTISSVDKRSVDRYNNDCKEAWI